MCEKLIEKNIPANFAVRVTHLHAGNSSRNARKGHAYMTIAKIVDRESQEVVSIGKAYCSRKEAPSRKVGRTVAVGRAMKEAPMYE